MSSSRASEYVHSLRRSGRLGNEVAAYYKAAGTSANVQPAAGRLPPAIVDLLSLSGIGSLYSHQVEALESIRNATHTVVATPTASGKSLIYNVSVFEAVLRDPTAKAFFIFPLKALAQDQFQTFEQWASVLPGLNPTAAIYDGDTSAYRRKKIRHQPPNVIMTNPEMLHLAFLPYHGKWRHFFGRLKLVIIDEVHTYRGLLGSHFAQVLRRLKRVCAFYGASPTFIYTSATVANPGSLAGALADQEVHSITSSGAPRSERHIVLMDAATGPARTAIELLKAAMARKLRTIVYTQSRKMAELIAIWAQQQAGRFADKISVYRAGLLPADRRIIEQRLRRGELLAVVSTSALELGIDIGDLDICILAGYPGSMIATWQRGGRVGRKGQESALIMIAAQDALDQYFITHPQAFFNGQAETAVINPFNPVLLDAHLECAAAELALQNKEPWLQVPVVRDAVQRLENKGSLLRSARGDAFFARRKRPHLSVDLRSAGIRYEIRDGQVRIGDINAFRVYRETHPGAVYLHQGQTYLVDEVDDAGRVIQVQPASVSFHTRTRSDSDIRIMEIYESKNNINTEVYIGKVKVTDRVIGYERVHTATGRSLGFTDLDAPPVIFETDSVWFGIPSKLCNDTIARGHDLLGSLHAAEHAAIGIMPLLVLTDRNDIGGLAMPYHPQVQSACIFIYDGLPGGAGFSLQAFQKITELLQRAGEVIQRCACDSGCPACIHSPKCGSGNDPMDKAGALFLIEAMASRDEKPAPASNFLRLEKTITTKAVRHHAFSKYGVFDLETQLSAADVGGWHMAHRMKVSCAVVYDGDEDEYNVYMEEQVGELIEHLKRLDLVVGFNSKRFDYKVLSGYCSYNFNKLPSLDLLELVYAQLGFRLSLDHLARQTLKTGKTGSGLDALRWWREGQMDKIVHYCRMDVEITRDLYRFARENGYLIYQRRDGECLRIPLSIP